MKSQTTSTCALERDISGVSNETYVKTTNHDTNFSDHQTHQFKDELDLEVTKRAYDPLTTTITTCGQEWYLVEATQIQVFGPIICPICFMQWPSINNEDI